MHTLGLNGGGVGQHDEWYHADITYPLPLQARHRETLSILLHLGPGLFDGNNPGKFPDSLASENKAIRRQVTSSSNLINQNYPSKS